MRIALVGAGMIPIPPPDYGAVEKHVWNLAQALRDMGHEVHVVNRVFGPRSRDEYRFALWARREVERLRCDVVHVHTPGVALVFSLLGPRRFVFTTHSRHWSTVEGLGETIGFELEKRAVRKAEATIAVSRLVATAMMPLGVKPTVVPNGVDLARYAPDRSARTGDRVVGLGEVAPHKRWHVAAEAIRGTNARLCVVGPIRDPVYATGVEDAAPGQVTLLGVVPEEDLTRILAESDVLVHPSASESFGMAVVEGMAAGLPVVASDVVSELVAHGENGFVIPTKGEDAERVSLLRKHLDVLLSDMHLRRLQGEASRARAAQYGWGRVAERVAEVYASVAGKPAQPVPVEERRA